MPEQGFSVRRLPCKVAVIWIDWYAYHVARFRGLMQQPNLAGHVRGIELVGGIGVHTGLRFREELPSDLPVETLMPGHSWEAAGQFTLARKLWRALTRFDPEVVLVPGYYTLPGLAAALWALLYRRTSVLMTESTAFDHRRVWWKEAAKGALIRALFDWAVCGGIAHDRYLEQLGFPHNRVVSSYDVVDNDFFATQSDLYRQQDNPPQSMPSNYFLYVGRLAPEKNVEGLLTAWLDYRTHGGTWPLVLVGAGPTELSLRQQASTSPFASEVYFAGQKSYHQLPLFYAFAGCFVLPSTREPWGLVVNEAMASGLPVIVSDRCGCAESLVEPGRNGLSFNPMSTHSLQECLATVSALTPLQRLAWSNHGATIVRNYSPNSFGEQINKVLIAI